MSSTVIEHSDSQNDEKNTSIMEDESLKADDSANRVEFFSNKEINDDDLSLLMLYLENKRVSGGGDTSSFTIDSSKRRLTVVYLNSEAKDRILQRQVVITR